MAADHTIHADEQGAYRIPLNADETITITIEAQYATIGHSARIFAISGTSEIYVRPGTQVTVGDPRSLNIPMYTWKDIDFGADGTVAIVSAEDAVVSVART
jgi:hypothetical protein